MPTDAPSYTVTAGGPTLVGCDVGGTFTDLVLVDEATGLVRVAKVPTTVANQAGGVQAALAGAAVGAADVGVIVHGTTTATNALTERKGARTGLITTRGFRDVLEIGRAHRPDLYNLYFQKPEPFVPRQLRRRWRERGSYKGEILEPLNEEEMRHAVRHLRDERVEAIAICFLHSYANPNNERRAVEIAREEAPDIAITASSEVTRQWREYERTSTAVLNAYVQPE